jgi:hypothetical protein
MDEAPRVNEERHIEEGIRLINFAGGMRAIENR